MTAAARLTAVPSTHVATAPQAPPRTPRTMTAHRIVTVVALVAAVTVFVVAMLTSAASLYEIAVASDLAAPWGLPVVLDLLATASAAVAWVTRSWGARLAAAGAFATSLALQVGHVWGQGPTVWVVHSAAPVGAVVMFEVALILAGRTTEPEVAAEAQAPVQLQPVAPVPVPRPVVAAAPAPARSTRPAKKAPARRSHSDEELAGAAVDLDAADPAAGILGNWKPMAAALKNAGYPIGTTRAQRILELARARKENPDA